MKTPIMKLVLIIYRRPVGGRACIINARQGLSISQFITFSFFVKRCNLLSELPQRRWLRRHPRFAWVTWPSFHDFRMTLWPLCFIFFFFFYKRRKNLFAFNQIFKVLHVNRVSLFLSQRFLREWSDNLIPACNSLAKVCAPPSGWHDDSPCANTLEDFGVWPTQQRKAVALCGAVISWREGAPVAERQTSAQLRRVRRYLRPFLFLRDLF